jgi:DtxR family Mn-dependent transcriptional regulator
VPSLTVENYVKTIYLLSTGEERAAALTGQIAATLRVSPSTVTAMLKTLGESGLITYAPYEGAKLTSAGTALALRVLRRHRLIELFLVKTLNLTWDEVHEEAENMEHAVSDLLIDRIDAYLGHPEFDPHGDPIPRADGSFQPPTRRSLLDCQVGEEFRLARVVDQSPEFLRFLADAGLPLGTTGRLVTHHREAGTVVIEVAGATATLGREAAGKILVTPPAESGEVEAGTAAG